VKFRQYLKDNNLSADHFITKNAWDGLEMNLIQILQLSLENKSENIFLHNSQVNENFFKLLRSYTGMQSMIVNVTMKGFIYRVHRIELEEFIMTDMSKKLFFPTLHSRSKKVQKTKENLSRIEIERIVQDAMEFGNDQCKIVGMENVNYDLAGFLKPVATTIIESVGSETSSDGLPKDYMDIESFSSDEDYQENEFHLQNMVLSNRASGMIHNFQVCFLALSENVADGSFLDVLIDGQPAKIRKQRLCWLLQDLTKLSSDVTHRYIPSYSFNLRELQSNSQAILWKTSEICRGDVICFSDNNLHLGVVVGFRKSSNVPKAMRVVFNDFIDIEKDKNMEIFLDPLYKITDTMLKIEIPSEKFYSSTFYVSHCQNVNVDLMQAKDLIESLSMI
jgi:hypothetical protein